MPAKSALDIQGLEHDWLASDADGRVAVFSTAGGGYAPDGYLTDTDAHRAAIEAILAEPARTTARVAQRHLDDSWWRPFAQRGLFTFDSNFFGGPYKLVLEPYVLICVDDLPKVAADVARRVVFPHLNFAQLREISVHALSSV